MCIWTHRDHGNMHRAFMSLDKEGSSAKGGSKYKPLFLTQKLPIDNC